MHLIEEILLYSSRCPHDIQTVRKLHSGMPRKHSLLCQLNSLSSFFNRKCTLGRGMFPIDTERAEQIGLACKSKPIKNPLSLLKPYKSSMSKLGMKYREKVLWQLCLTCGLKFLLKRTKALHYLLDPVLRQAKQFLMVRLSTGSLSCRRRQPLILL